jgi:UPF0716 family protein affecting phage T7 exclusion
MLAPQYSLRKFIGFVTISAFACLIVAAGLRGQLWGVAVMIAFSSLGLLLLVHASLFAAVTALGRLVDARQRLRQRSAQPHEPSK